MGFDLNTPINYLPATSVITIRRLKSLGIKTYWDLLNYFPFRYENYSLISKIAQLQEGEVVTVFGQIIDSQSQMIKTGLSIQKFTLQDETGIMELNWYNQPYLLKLLKKSINVSVAGEVKRFGRKTLLYPKEYEIINEKIENNRLQLKHTGRIIPIYPEKRGLSSKTIREKIFYLLAHLDNDRGENETSLSEILPEEIIHYNALIDELSAYKNIHFPENLQGAKKARERLAFDEMFLIQLNSALIRKEWEKETVGNPFKMKEKQIEALKEFINHLPFKLTNAQKKVWSEILYDLQQTKPMNRFLQGEVGSGKTVVAALACYLAYLNGFQSLFMAPTEILAFQHYQTISYLFKDYPIKIGLYTGSKKISNSNFDIIIGTHALIQKEISFEKVGLVIIDEQHRFGVVQRAMLKEKGVNPHLLTMTATPIPRTVMLTLYGELDLSVIDEMPKGRLIVKTYLIPKHKREDCYLWIKDKIKKENAQVFIICPLIEQSQTETMKSVKAATKEFKFLKENVFPEFSLGLLHGKIKSKEKEKIMQDFKEKKYQILVTTSVVEVGVDIPSATIMIIEGAERFGLAQLHQLRGRVGRGKKQSYCFLFTEEEKPHIIRRLKFFSQTTNGNLLAQKDLELRGPGTIYGTKQHGFVDLKIASFSNYRLIEKTKKAIGYFINHYQIKNFPGLEKRVKEYQINLITKD